MNFYASKVPTAKTLRMIANVSSEWTMVAIVVGRVTGRTTLSGYGGNPPADSL